MPTPLAALFNINPAKTPLLSESLLTAVCHFLDLTALTEGTQDSPITLCNGYDVIVTGIDGPDPSTDKAGPERMLSFITHPFENRRPKLFREPDEPNHRSDAAGRYQCMKRNYDVYKVQLHLPDFSPLSQDLIAVQQMRERHATTLLNDGNVRGAIAACSNIWASFPGDVYGQGSSESMDAMMEKWTKLVA